VRHTVIYMLYGLSISGIIVVILRIIIIINTAGDVPYVRLLK